MPDTLPDSDTSVQASLFPPVAKTEAEKLLEQNKQRLRDRMADSGVAWIPSEDEE
jgi:hypothetical protein